jgi:hypothetical protein
MIWESSFWKEPLLGSANWLRKVRLTDRTTEKTFVRMEKELFLGFYSIRKLLDAKKVSTATETITFEMTWYPNTKHVDYLNRQRIDELYDLNKANTETRDLRFLCNQFIHSYVFSPVVDSQRIKGFYLSSKDFTSPPISSGTNDCILWSLKLY